MRTRDNIKWQIISNGVLTVFTLCALLPFILLVVASFTDETVAVRNGYSFFPEKLSVDAYTYILRQWETIGRGYLNTIFVTLIGTTLSMIVTSLFAYALASEKLPGVRILNFLCIFTMLFSGGQVASYYIWSNLFHIRDTIWALVFPGWLMNAFNVILVKNYYKTSIPPSLKEAAKISGCGEFGVFIRIVLPLSVPINATIGLMTGLNYWNDWINGLYYLTERKGSQFYTIQIILNQISDSIAYLQQNATATTIGSNFPSTTARMAIAVTGVLPVLIAYPFLQKYFVKGITLGAVKE
jgi:putative aldouronate transport system permease protein